MRATIKLTEPEINEILKVHFGIKGFNVDEITFRFAQTYDRMDQPLGINLTCVEVSGELPKLN